MKIHPDIISVPFISSYGKGWVQVAGQQLTRSVVISSDGRQFEWPCARFDELTPAHFEQLAQLKTELVIFGSGERLRFPAPALTRALIECQIGIESMDTQAACRTYNILAGEGRHVAVALLMESSGDQ
ncbi:MAG: hypothetical protein RLZZ371_2141 [Pseudomonadota bacterium]